ncbi:MAG TPA: hypothetical protein VF316_07015 [Polyangiaceae bacterium]
MRLREISYALKAAAEVARAGEHLVDRTRSRGYTGPVLTAAADVAQAGEHLFGSLDRTRSRSYVVPVLLGVGVGIGIGALLFSEAARERVAAWLFGESVTAEAPHETVDTTVEEMAEPDVEATSPRPN